MSHPMRITFPVLAMTALFCGPAVTWGQSRGNTGGSSSMFPSSATTGGSTGGFGAASSMSSMFGSGSSSGMGNSGFGSTGSTGFGQTGQNPFGQQNAGAFIGRNLNANSFIGRTAQGTQTGQGTQGNNRSNQAGRGGGQRNTDLQQLLQGQMGGQGNQNQNNGLMGRNSGIRPRLKVGFEATTPVASTAVEVTRARFENLSSRNPQLASVSVEMASDGTAVLTGDVKSQSDSQLAENLLRLEPGIRKVRNELSYPEPTTDQ